MQLEHIKATVAGVWIVGVAIAGIVVAAPSLSNWIVLACVALLPPLAMMRLWKAPRQTMSERINEARR